MKLHVTLMIAIHACVLVGLLPSPVLAQGGIASWGSDNSGQVSNTPVGTGFTQVSGGNSYSVALRADGSIAVWGNDRFGQVSDTPIGTGFTQVAGGLYHSLALRADGSIASWGRETAGVVSNTPVGTGFTQVSGGSYHSLALRADGSIASWGADGSGVVSNTPIGTGFTQVAGGHGWAHALQADGSIASWGGPSNGNVANTPVGGGFTQVAAAYDHSLALRADGSIASWGHDGFGQVSNTPVGTGFTQVAGGAAHSLALRADGSIASWGNDGYGQVSNTPVGTGFTQVSGVSGWHCLALEGTPRSPWTLSPINGHWYLPIGQFTWTDAEAEALAFGGHLATVRSAAENDWLLSTFASTDSIWIGYTDQAAEGTFEWINGEPVGYENWAVGEPDDGSGADWAVLDLTTGLWRDETHLPEHHGVVEVISDDCDGDQVPDVAQIAIDPGSDWNGDSVLDSCIPANFCTAAVNSSGLAGVVGASGTPIIADNDFTLMASDLPLGEYGYFLMSESTGFVQGFGGSAGNLCLGAPIIRFSLSGQVVNSGAAGAVDLDLDLTDLPQNTAFLPGDTWYFQLWFRDVFTSNTTDGIEVMFQ